MRDGFTPYNSAWTATEKFLNSSILPPLHVHKVSSKCPHYHHKYIYIYIYDRNSSLVCHRKGDKKRENPQVLEHRMFIRDATIACKRISYIRDAQVDSVKSPLAPRLYIPTTTNLSRLSIRIVD